MRISSLRDERQFPTMNGARHGGVSARRPADWPAGPVAGGWVSPV